MKVPRVFVSYSHDSQEHKKWVLDLATRLRNNGVDAVLDQWELKAGDDLPRFMERNLASSKRVLMVCTDRYVEKANSGSGGVGYEKMIITSDMLKSIDSNKVIPIIRQIGSHSVPLFLKTKLFIDFSRSDEFEFSFDELVRTIHETPLFIKPAVGNNPFTPLAKQQPKRNGDAVLKLMRVVVEDFESHTYDFTNYKTLTLKTDISRIMLDNLIEQAVAQGLLAQDDNKDVWLTEKGKQYAINQKIIG